MTFRLKIRQEKSNGGKMMQHFKAAALFAAGVLTASTVGFDDCQPQEQQGDRTFAVSSR